jgi:hypothetical protein
MNLSIKFRHPSSVLAVLALAGTACAVEATDPTHAQPSAPVSSPSNASRADEDARVQDFLDGMYRATDVQHSFHSAAGQDIDCVAYEAEPGVRAMLAQGHTVDELRHPTELTPAQLEYNKTARKAPRAFAGDPDEAGRTRECPAGTVPHVRVTKEHIESVGGLDAYVALMSKKTAPRATVHIGGETCPYADVDNYQWVTGGWTDISNSAVANQGGRVTLAIAQPTIDPGTGDHSLAQSWTTGVSGCTVQTVEAGWTVDSGVNSGSLAPHIFIFSTASTYGATSSSSGATGCYNNVGPNCVTWIPEATSPYYPGAPLPPSVSGGAQHEIAISTQHVFHFNCILVGEEVQCLSGYTGWQVAVSVDGAAWESLGYYANSAYGTGPLATGATEYEVGSEVYNWEGNSNVVVGSPGVTMGEAGIFALQTSYYGSEAYLHDYSLTSPANTNAPGVVQAYVGVGETAETCSAFGSCPYTYTTADTKTPGSSAWKNWWYYGDTIPLLVKR